ncbi:MAG: T9SS type A sorting domain-containing protein [Bacteroidota bacterium]
MKKIKLVLLFCILLMTSKVSLSQTATAICYWHGGWCTVCGNDYSCSSGVFQVTWYNGTKTFTDPIPAGGYITGIEVTVCEADCGISSMGVAINGSSIGTYQPNSNCWCYQTHNFSVSNGGISNYHYGTTDTLTLSPNSTVCVTTATIVFTYVMGAHITTNPLSTNQYCPGDVMMVPYYAVGVFNSGNVFTAQLSNSTGSFASPTNIGTVTSTTSGTITCNIPALTPTGTGYRVRVVGSNPSTIGTDNGTNITIANNAPSITASGPTTFCAGGNVTLTASSGNSYSWSPGGQTTQSIVATAAGSYTVHVTNISGCSGTSAATTITINPVPSNPGPITGPVVLCSYATTVYTIAPVTNATSYFWTVPLVSGFDTAIIVSGQGTTSIAVSFASNSGNVTCTPNNACGNSLLTSSLWVTITGNYGNGYWIGGVDTDWFTPANWCGPVPDQTIDVWIDGSMGTTWGYHQYFPKVVAYAHCRDLRLVGRTDSLTICGSNWMYIYGDFFNGTDGGMGDATFLSNSSTVAFMGTAADNRVRQEIDGTNPMVFYNIYVNKGTNIADDSLVNYSGYPGYPATISQTGVTTLVNGTFRLSEPTSAIVLGSPYTIPSTAGLVIDGGVLLRGNYNLVNHGLFKMTENATNDTIGTASGNTFTTDGSTALTEIDGGNLFTASQLVVSNGGTFVSNDALYNTNTGLNAKVTLNTVGTSNNSTTLGAVFNVDATSNMDIESGLNLIFRTPNSGTGEDVRITSGGTKTINGGLFQFGDASTASNSTFKVVNSTVPFNNFTINSANTPTVQLDADASLNSTGVLNLTAGKLLLNKHVLTLNNGTGINTNVILSTMSSGAVQRTTGYIIAEDSLNQSAIKWTLNGIVATTHIYPFGNSYGSYIPFAFKKYSGATTPAGFVKVSTYAPTVNTTTHRPYPSAPDSVTHLRYVNSPYTDNSPNVANRFWQIDTSGVPTGLTWQAKFVLANTSGHNEEPTNGNTNLVAQRWNKSNHGWVSSAVSAPSGNTNVGSGDTIIASGIVSFSPWTISRSAFPLPIELLNFTANYNGKTVDLNWSTVSEINNDYFTIYRTQNNSDFDFIAQVHGNGNSNATNYYSSIDPNPLMGTSYYQLKQTDYDGNSTSTGLVPVVIGKENFEIVKLYSDDTKMHILINDNTNENIDVTVFDILGNQIVKQSSRTTSQITDVQINTSGLPRGIYFVMISNSNKVIKGKIIY